MEPQILKVKNSIWTLNNSLVIATSIGIQIMAYTLLPFPSLKVCANADSIFMSMYVLFP